jgi:hypothetical protein
MSGVRSITLRLQDEAADLTCWHEGDALIGNRNVPNPDISKKSNILRKVFVVLLTIPGHPK